MPQIPIIMPQLGESIAEATIVHLLVEPGQAVQGDQDILEVETNKATMNVTSPCAGKIETYKVQIGESYAVGAVLGYVEASQEEAERLGWDAVHPSGNGDDRPADDRASEEDTATRSKTVKPTVRGLPVPASAQGATYMSPRMKARMNDLGMHAADLSAVAGSGAAGRVTILDFEKYIESLEQQKLSQASTMRVAVADAMRRSWTRPLATVGLPVQLDALFAHRKQSNPKPGPALYALRALAIALAENSAPAGRLVGNKIVHPQSIDIGFAVEAADGVLVPVIRNVDQKKLPEIVEVYDNLIKLAHQRKLPANATGGSIATITNFGTFGLQWATPIPLPEQTLVLGMGAGRKVPAWDEAREEFVPVMEANFTLSFDHRVLDGGAAGRLLQRIGVLLNNPGEL